MSKSNIFSQDDQSILMESIEKIENFKGNLKESDISFISKNNQLFNIDTPWSRKLNFAFFTRDSSIERLINNFDNIQYIDSDIGFI